MNFTHFLKIVFQESFFQCNRPNGPKYANTEKGRMGKSSWRNNIYNNKWSVETRLEHGFAMELRISDDYSCLHTVITITAYTTF